MVYHRARSVNRILDLGVISAIAPTAVSQIPFTGHPLGTLRRTFLSVRMSVRILSAASPPPPVQWIDQVWPTVSVQIDTGGPPATPADPGTGDDRILQVMPMRKQYRPGADATVAYAVDFWTDTRIDTRDMRKGTGSGSNYPTVTAYLWTNDQDNWLGSTFYSGRKISYQSEMSVIYSDVS